MMKRHKKLYRAALSVLMLIALFAGLPSAPASADAEMRRTVIGADLDETQIETVYRSFGIERGTVPELRLTNAEERAALAGSLDEAVIGTRAISCVYFELLPEGSGLLVRTENISFCTAEMYRNSLSKVTTPERSMEGTYFLSDERMRHYTVTNSKGSFEREDMTGETLNTEAKTAGTQELTITGELADELGSDDSAQSIIGELKAMLSETAGMTDDEIRETIRGIADEHNVRLTETQVQQLLDLCRALEKLDPERLSQSAEDAKNTLQKMEDAKEKVGGFLQTVKRAFESVKSLFEKLAELTGRKS